LDIGLIARGDLLRVRVRGTVQAGFWLFEGTFDDKGTTMVALRRMGAASPRYWRADDLIVIDHDARW
jgi:hypothetical protein